MCENRPRRISGTWPGCESCVDLGSSRRVGTRPGACDRGYQSRCIDDAAERRLVDLRQRLAARAADQVGTVQPVEQTGGEGVTRADRVHQIDRHRASAQLQARGDGVEA